MGKKIMKNKLNSDGFKYINGEFGCKMWRYKYKDGSKRYSKFWIDYSIKK